MYSGCLISSFLAGLVPDCLPCPILRISVVRNRMKLYGTQYVYKIIVKILPAEPHCDLDNHDSWYVILYDYYCSRLYLLCGTDCMFSAVIITLVARVTLGVRTPRHMPKNSGVYWVNPPKKTPRTPTPNLF